MLAVKTVDDKNAALRARKDQERELGAQIDRAMRSVEAGGRTSGGCFSGLLALFWRPRKTHTDAQSTEMAPASSGSAAFGMANGSRVAHATLFGLGSKADPHAKLGEAARAMEQRIAQLEERASECREEARRLVQVGQKGAAMRALKKAKAIEKQAEANQASLLAVEQQLDLMAQATIQKTVASALKTSTRGMKADKKLLKHAEDAVDEAQEARDMATDLSAVMADFAHNGGPNDLDEDALLAELEEMAGTVPPPPASASSNGTSQIEIQTAADAAAAAASAVLAERHAAWDAADAVRAALPSAPTKKTKKEESQGLLSV